MKRKLSIYKNVSWNQHMRNEVLYGEIPKITTTIVTQRARFSGHCWRSKDELAHQLLLWEQTHGKRARGRPRQKFIDQLLDDMELQKEDLANAMNDREYWKSKVVDVRLRSIRWWWQDLDFKVSGLRFGFRLLLLSYWIRTWKYVDYEFGLWLLNFTGFGLGNT